MRESFSSAAWQPRSSGHHGINANALGKAIREVVSARGIQPVVGA
jgi:hypothetical protein